MRNKSSKFLLIILSSVLAIAISGPAQAKNSKTTKTDVFTFMNPDGSDAPGNVTGKAFLKRTETGLSLRIRTTELDPGYAYTVWWIIFNNPGACAPGGCTDMDFENPDVEASVMHATGRVADDNGKARFSAFLPVGSMHTNPSSGNGRQLFGPGLQNLKKAEIHVVIRCHGAWVGPFMDVEQLSTFNGDCVFPDPSDPPDGTINICYDIQAAVFPLPGRKRNHGDSDSDSDSDSD